MKLKFAPQGMQTQTPTPRAALAVICAHGRTLKVLAVLLCVQLPELAQAAPCPAVVQINTGETLGCDGIVFPEAQARAALACFRVDVPRCRADAVQAARLAAIDLAECTSRTSAALQGWNKCEAATLSAPGPASLSKPESPLPWAWLAAGAALGASAMLALRIALK